MSDKNKPLEIAKSVEKKIRKIVDEMFVLAEVDKEKDAESYYKASNTIFASVCACAAQRMLEDGLMTGRLRGKVGLISPVARDLFLSNHPEIVKEIAAKAAQNAIKLAEEPDEDESEDDEDESDNDE